MDMSLWLEVLWGLYGGDMCVSFLSPINSQPQPYSLAVITNQPIKASSAYLKRGYSVRRMVTWPRVGRIRRALPKI